MQASLIDTRTRHETYTIRLSTNSDAMHAIIVSLPSIEKLADPI